jgi:cobalt-zinc-cadmium efflux system membrane fusion protein
MQQLKSMNRKQLALALLGLVIVLTIAWFSLGLGKKNGPPAATQNVPVPEVVTSGTLKFEEGSPQLSLIQSQSIPLSSIPTADELNARLAYDDDVTSRLSPSFSGRIIELKAAPGDVVKTGQVLAVIDSPDFGIAQADLNKARADEKRKLLALKRAKDLVPGEAISNRDFEVIQADYAQAQAETARAEQRLKNLNPHDLVIKGQKVILASPMDGVVTERNASPSLEVSPGMSTPLFVVTDPKRLWLSIDLPEAFLGQVKVGGDVAVSTDAYRDESFKAKIIQLGQIINPNTRRATVMARVDNSEGKLLPEMFARAAILQTSGQGVRIPNESLIIRGMYSYVFVETKPGEFKLQQVKLVKRGIDFSYVGEGLKGDERVVTKGALLLDAELLSRTGDK